MVEPMGICEKHQLPLDRNGECELCRLSEMPSKAPPSPSPWWALIIPLLLLGAAVVWALSSMDSNPEVAPQRGVRAAEPRPAGPAPVRPSPREPEPEIIAPEPPAPSPDIPSEEIPVPKPPADQTPETTQLDQLPPLPAEPAAEEVPDWKMDLARKRVMITMYATQWCGVCRKARDYMEANRIDFMELDTDDNAVAQERLGELNPRKTIPTFQIDELVYVGFREDIFEANLDKAAQKHL